MQCDDLIWKIIPNTDNKYKISNYGDVLSAERYVTNNINGGKRKVKARLLKQKTKSNGYQEVNLHIHTGKGSSKYVHRLVVESFLGEIPDNCQVNHIDGDKSNNNLSNLEIVTPSENRKHSLKVLGNKAPSFKGGNHPGSKLSEEDVIFIRDNFKKGENNSDLFNKFPEVCHETIRSIAYRRSWTHIL